MTLLQEFGFQKTRSEIFIDEKRPDVDFEIIVKPEDYVNGIKHDPAKSPLAIAVSRAISGSGFMLDRAGFKVIIICKFWNLYSLKLLNTSFLTSNLYLLFISLCFR